MAYITRMNTMDIRTANTILYCRKWDETVAFYKSQLKLEVTASLEWFVEFKLNETSRLSIANEARTSMDSNDGKGITIAMEVDDIAETYSVLKETGLHPTAIRDHPWGAKVLYIYDPEGNRLEFWTQNREID
jgi:predicted enzyme related to lactoylglutathione lyase